jgi:hypothetical protein
MQVSWEVDRSLLPPRTKVLPSPPGFKWNRDPHLGTTFSGAAARVVPDDGEANGGDLLGPDERRSTKNSPIFRMSYASGARAER